MSWSSADLLRHLDRLAHGKIALGLERIGAACERLGHPERAIRALHIAGTNGKGSTGAFCRALLGAAGCRIGHYCSPHLAAYAERFQLDGSPVDDTVLARTGERVARACRDLPLSHFEFTTALAFLLFAEAEVEYGIIEVGLGGRWDATNVIVPLVSVLTPIGMDHQEYLGNTIAAIAGEKCGIIKPGVPVVSARQSPEVTALIAAACREAHAPLTVAEPVGAGIPLGLAGMHQRTNAGVALAAAALLRKKWGLSPFPTGQAQAALAAAVWPGRCEWFSHDPAILFDGAHNVDAATTLTAYLREVRQGREVVCCLGVMRDKDVLGIVAALRPAVDRFIALTAPTERGLPGEDLAAIIRAQGASVAIAVEIGAGFAHACTHVDPHALLVITGSLYLYAPACAVMKNYSIV